MKKETYNKIILILVCAIISASMILSAIMVEDYQPKAKPVKSVSAKHGTSSYDPYVVDLGMYKYTRRNCSLYNTNGSYVGVLGKDKRVYLIRRTHDLVLIEVNLVGGIYVGVIDARCVMDF